MNTKANISHWSVDGDSGNLPNRGGMNDPCRSLFFSIDPNTRAIEERTAFCASSLNSLQPSCTSTVASPACSVYATSYILC